MGFVAFKKRVGKTLEYCCRYVLFKLSLPKLQVWNNGIKMVSELILASEFKVFLMRFFLSAFLFLSLRQKTGALAAS